MIYTVTFNPSLDYIMKTNNIKIGEVNRSEEEEVVCGGKGINVSIMLNTLGVNNVALGYIAGFTGKEINKRLSDMGVNTDFIPIDKGMSRINCKIESNEVTEINGSGPRIENSHREMLYNKLDKLCEGDMLVLAGSIPKNLSSNVYGEIMERLTEKNISIVVDACGELLLNTLRYHPFLIKPNHIELEELCGMACKDKDSIIYGARQLQQQGARNVLVSRGREGGILITEDNNVLEMNAPKGAVANTVGAGDSMVAGFIAKYLESRDYKEALEYSVIVGSATAFSRELATKEKIECMM